MTPLVRALENENTDLRSRVATLESAAAARHLRLQQLIQAHIARYRQRGTPSAMEAIGALELLAIELKLAAMRAAAAGRAERVPSEGGNDG